MIFAIAWKIEEKMGTFIVVFLMFVAMIALMAVGVTKKPAIVINLAINVWPKCKHSKRSTQSSYRNNISEALQNVHFAEFSIMK